MGTGFAPLDYLAEPAALGRMQRVVIPGTAPAAGASFTLDLDPQWTWRLLSVRARLVTDASAANRELTLQYLDGGRVVFDEMGAATTIPASQTYDYTFSAFQPFAEFPVNAGILVPLHSVFLPGNYRIKLNVVNVQATDALSAIRIYAEQWWSDEAR